MRASPLKPRKHAVQDRGRRTVEAILEAAAQVFARRGYAGGTTNHIAERAGVSVGSVYQYFPNKDAILVALVRRHMASGMELLEPLKSLDAVRGVPLDALLQRFVGAVVRLHTDDPNLHRVLFEEAPHPKDVRQLLHRIEEETAGWVEALLRDHPEVRVRDPAAAAYFVVQTVEGLAHHYVLHAPRSLAREQFERELVTMLRAYLGAG